jgi:glycosyltransferase involved in cell wall biosynthesis
MSRILVLVENLSVPFDRRVWQESRALRDAGHDVTVVCPAGNGRDSEPDVVVEGIRILRYPPRPATGGPVGHLREYSWALWHMLRLALRVRRAGRVDAVHACNPPDLLFLVALPLKALGARFVFDHHDLVPELLDARFAGVPAFVRRAVLLTERLTFALADGVISTNETYRRVAVQRGRVAIERTAVVRSAPDGQRFRPRAPDPTLRRGRRHLAAYLGVMGPQDGVDRLLHGIARLRDDHGRDDLHTILMGGGDAFDDLVALRDELGLADRVELHGWADDEMLQRCLSTADVCLSPDPLTPFNDASSMNKVVEYMAMGRPIVAFDLAETRVSAGGAAVYAPPDDEPAFARLIDDLLRDPARRAVMGRIGLTRSTGALSWDVSRAELVAFYDRVLAGRGLPADHRPQDEQVHGGEREHVEHEAPHGGERRPRVGP